MKNILGLILAFLASTPVMWAQPVNGNLPTDKKLEIGDDNTGRKDTYNALEWYEKAYNDDNENVLAIYKVASTHDKLRDYEAAEEWYGRLVEKDKAGEYPLARFWYAYTMKLNGNYKGCIDEFKTFKNEYSGKDADYYKRRSDVEIEGAEYAIEIGEESYESVIVENVGSNINSNSTEGAPYPMGREQIIYSSLRSDSLIYTEEASEEAKFAAIYTSTKVDGEWEEAQRFNEAVEKAGFHAVHPCFSTDKSKFYFVRAQLDGNMLENSRIYMATADGDNIGTPKALDFNSGEYSCKSPHVAMFDGKEYLFFASNMGGGEGGWDIWYAEIKEDGTTYQPINLGAPVNTFVDEITPYYDTREELLYFASNGHPGIGGYDIFKSAGTSVDSWGDAENMGFGFNSRVDDFSFIINEEGVDDCYGMVVSNRPGTMSLKSETCCDDIFSIIMPERCDVVVDVETFDQETGDDLIGATVQLINTETGEVYEEKTNTEGNEFSFLVPVGEEFKIKTIKEGYEEGGETMVSTKKEDIGEITEPLTIDKETEMKEMGLMVETFDKVTNAPLNGVTIVVYDKDGKEVERQTETSKNRFVFSVPRNQDYKVVAELTEYFGDEKMVTKKELGTMQKLYLEKPSFPMFVDILFDFDKANIREDAAKILDDVAKILTDRPELVIEVRGHTDSKGANRYNDRLSKRRSNSAIKYLTKKGINEDRLLPKGFGEEDPKADNEIEGKDNPDGRQLNRRVEFKILDEAEAEAARSEMEEEKKNEIIKESGTSSTDKPARKNTTISFNPAKYHNYGTVKMGSKKEFMLEITNTGKDDLEIDFVQGSCECTLPLSYPKKPIKPGDKGTITFEFDSNKASVQDAYNSGLEIYGNFNDGVMLFGFDVDIKP